MPLVDLWLVSFEDPLEAPAFIQNVLNFVNRKDLVAIAKCRFLFIPPQLVDAKALSNTRWDLLFLINPGIGLPLFQSKTITRTYTLKVGIPSKLLAGYPAHNKEIRHASPNVPLTGSLAEMRTKIFDLAKTDNLELTPRLLEIADAMVSGEGLVPVSMLNLLCFNEGKRDDYLKYGQGFKQAGGRRGGDAKLVGNIIRGDATKAEQWNEMAYVHYPSIYHFCDMSAGKDYQEINNKHRLGALKDTLLLCTTEIDLDDIARHRL